MTSAPYTRESLAADLRDLGVRRSAVLLAHASLRSLGFVCGGPQAVVAALRDALGPDGTLVVPTHTPDNSDPADWSNPPVPEDWWPVIRRSMPGFDPAVTPSRWMGALAEQVRTWPGARRSDHPQVSFAALGPAAGRIVDDHPLAEMLGDGSPLGRLHDLDAQVLLLGVGHAANTSLHLAEYRQTGPPRAWLGAAVRAAPHVSGGPVPVTAGGTAADPAGDAVSGTAGDGRKWVRWEDVDIRSDDFDRLGADLEATGAVRTGRVGAAECRLMRQREAVDFAVDWLARNRRVAGDRS